MIWVWVKRWAIVAVGLPLLAWVVDRVADGVERSRGRSDLTQGMHGAAEKLRSVRRKGRRDRR